MEFKLNDMVWIINYLGKLDRLKYVQIIDILSKTKYVCLCVDGTEIIRYIGTLYKTREEYYHINPGFKIE